MMKRVAHVTVTAAVLSYLARPSLAVSLQNYQSLDGNAGIMLSEVTRVMLTEAQTEFGLASISHRSIDTSYQLDSISAEELWKQAVNYEWQMAIDRELSNEALGEEIAYTPFLICDKTYGKSGAECLHTIQQVTGTADLLPMYNKDDMTCFIASVPASRVSSNLPTGIVALPLLTDMKLAPNLSYIIGTSDPVVSRVEAIMCPGNTKIHSNYNKVSNDHGDDLNNSASNDVSVLIDYHKDGDLRHLKTFMHTRTFRHKSRQLYWENIFAEFDHESCKSLLRNATIDDTEGVLAINVPRSSNTLDDRRLRQCIHSITLYLSQQPNVCFIGAYQEPQVYNKYASGVVQSGRLDYKPFYDAGIDGSGQVVAISDSGVDIDNCYFRDATRNTVRDKSAAVDLNARKIVQYYTYIDGTDTDGGHGTHVAGSIAGRRADDGRSESDGEGDGVARGSKLAVFDIGDNYGNMHMPPVDLLFETGRKAGALIHSISWGIPLANSYTPTDYRFDAYLVNNPEFLVVVAVGNTGYGFATNSVSSPATCKNALSVGASQSAQPTPKSYVGGTDYLADFSSRGPTADGRIKPEVVAPGTAIRSAGASKSTVGECDRRKGLIYKEGTSMAVPLVSGTAALIRQYFQEGWHVAGVKSVDSGINPLSSLVKAVLINSGQPLLGIEERATNRIFDTEPYDAHQGFGQINLLSTLPLKGQNSISAQFIDRKSIGNSETHQYAVRIRSGKNCQAPLSATLVWIDPLVGSFCNVGCVINDLDLSVTKDGQLQRFYPNGLSTADKTNNAERVRIDNPHSGSKYTVHVYGSQLIDNQEYSLVISGCFDNVDDTSISGERTSNLSWLYASTPQKPDTADCRDKSGNILVNIDMIRDCIWLLNNFDEFSYLCGFIDVAIQCPLTCNVCDSVQVESRKNPAHLSLTTDIDGDVRWHGMQFTITTKVAILLYSIDIHMSSSSSQRVEVYGRPYSNSTWTRFCEATIDGQGRGSLVAIPPSSCSPVLVHRQSSYFIYISLLDSSELVMTRVKDVNLTTAYNNDLSIESGSAVTYNHRDRYAGYNWNGRLHYTKPLPSYDEPECQDESDMVLIDHKIGRRSCAWLRENWSRFWYACKTTEVALFCKATCNTCSRLRE